MKYEQNELTAILVDSFDFLDNKAKREILSLIDGGKDITSAVVSTIGELNKDNLEEVKKSLNNDYLRSLLQNLQRVGAVALTCYSKDYPDDFKEVFEPPIVVYAKGDLSLLAKEKRIAIVGSRRCLPSDKKHAELYAKELTENGFVVVTGIAEGVDASAIKGALATGNVISITAGGFDKVYPKENDALFKSVAQKGLCLSEQRPTVKSMPHMYPYRNRLIAGLSSAVVVVSAGEKSGTLHTVSYALDQGKEVFALPHDVGSASGVGSNALIKSGAFLTDTPQDILEYYGVEVKKETKVELEGFEKELYDIIKEEKSVHIDMLAIKTKRQAFTLTPVLSMLEIKGLIAKSAGNYYTCII